MKKENKRTILSYKNKKGKYPDLMDIKYYNKLFSFEALYKDRLKEELYKSIIKNLPISDSKKRNRLDFINYFISTPEYSIKECIERGLTYSVSLKIRVRLSSNTNPLFKDLIQDVNLGNIPYMTPEGSFIINGTERVIVYQLHRSPGIYFSKILNNNGIKIYSAKVITNQGSCLEFTIDINNIMYVDIESNKKIPITTLLRAIGYETNHDIFKVLKLYRKVKLKNYHKLSGYKIAVRITTADKIVSNKQGKVISIKKNKIILNKDIILNSWNIKKIIFFGIESVIVYKKNKEFYIIENTLKKDSSNSGKEAVEFIYKQLTNYNSPNEKFARSTIEKSFFTDISLGIIGRSKINKKLKININTTILTKVDIIYIIKYLIPLANDNIAGDDMDHICNRNVLTVVEQLSIILEKGFVRMARLIKENMSILINEAFAPVNVITYKKLSKSINSFFCTSPLSQFMDQTNPLSEITHKRRLSSLGPGGLSRERAGLDVRDVHYSYYGRICPIETSEGQNIGLISSFSLFARINNLGQIETIYKRLKNGSKDKFEYISINQENDKYIVPANILIDDKGRFINRRNLSRLNGDITMATQNKISYLDVANNQLTSISASLIPFMEHDDANRALMGSNMMRQSLPLLNPESPIVGTGLEDKVVSDYRSLIHAEDDGIVHSIGSNHITIIYNRTEEEKLISFDSSVKRYKLLKFSKTNQNTTISLKPIVRMGMEVKKGQVLCEGFATVNGELALGRNLLVAFMPWKGYNFEDALVISESVVKEDLLTSIHIEEYSLEVRETRYGLEELTNEIPNLRQEEKNKLDKNGIIRVGIHVKPGDILIGKLTPKEDVDPTTEEKFLRALFGEKIGKFKDSSLRYGPNLHGVVIGKKLFYRSTKKTITKTINLKYKKYLYNLHNKLCNKLYTILQSKYSQGVYNDLNNNIIPKGILFKKKILYNIKNYSNISIYEWTLDNDTNRLISIIMNNYKNKIIKIKDELKRQKKNLILGDDLPLGVIKLAKVYIAKKRKLKVGDKMSGRHGNKGVVAKIVRDEDMPFLEDGTKVDLVLNPLGVPSRMNIGQIYETLLGWVGHKLKKKYANPIFEGASIEQIYELLYKAGLPRWGSTYLYDGQTGERFHKPATVGILYMLKLEHMVDDKMHARSTGPYSIITQQPLGGKSQFGGQRFGEMEVWALESFGASNILREMLTIKSDDVLGRSKTYEAIVKGQHIPHPGFPESFNVLLHELQGLGFQINLE
jgi:DNA-directed RNA polymerase subunit beta